MKAYCRLRGECSDDAIGIYLKEVRRPTYLSVRTNLHSFLTVSHLLPVKVNVP